MGSSVSLFKAVESPNWRASLSAPLPSRCASAHCDHAGRELRRRVGNVRHRPLRADAATMKFAWRSR